MDSITQQIYSNDYKDYILPYSDTSILTTYQDFGAQLLDSRYLLIHDSKTNPQFPIQKTEGLYNEYPYTPKVFTTLSTVSLETAGIIQVQTQPYLDLSGKNVLIGFIDTGINYLHPAFLNADGTSKIVSIWDQSIPDEAYKNPYLYGTIYDKEQINSALKSDSPLSIVPSADDIGHGTALAGIACGAPSSENDFIGAAYDANICVVKLKRAKEYLYDYYFADVSQTIYQENDIMMGINFLISQAEKYEMPLVICLGIGTNQGDHSGNTALSQMITALSYNTYTTVAIACGNEGNQGHHIYRTITNDPEEVEILVPENSIGFFAELWGSTNALFSIGFQTPLGTNIAPIAVRPGQTEQIPFVLEESVIEVSYNLVTESGGNQLIAIRISKPSSGNWIFRIFNNQNTKAAFHIWLPVRHLLANDVTFYNPNPDTTITIPSDSKAGISTTYYSGYDNSFALDSSRGYTSDLSVKPNLCTPGIRITAPDLKQGYQSFSGSSAASALLSGSIALLQEWRMKQTIPGIFNSSLLTGYLTRGAIRMPDETYPNPKSGYGNLNIYNIFQSIMQ